MIAASRPERGEASRFGNALREHALAPGYVDSVLSIAPCLHGGGPCNRTNACKHRKKQSQAPFRHRASFRVEMGILEVKERVAARQPVLLLASNSDLIPSASDNPVLS
jgi:hypothetical protein